MENRELKDPNFEAWVEQAVEAFDWEFEQQEGAVVQAIRKLRDRGQEIGHSMFVLNGGVYPLV